MQKESPIPAFQNNLSYLAGMKIDGDWNFDEIRPYHQAEIPQVMRRIVEKTSLFVMTGVFFPELSPEEIKKRFLQIQTTEEFQDKYMGEALRRMVASTVQTLTVEGIEKLDPTQSYLFIANHRDIVLDPGIFNEYRHSKGFPTTLIAIGDNLLVSGLVTDLMKLNKSFIVHRSVPRHQLMRYSQRLSQFIRQQMFSEGESIWIAQRSGRAKDGNDETQTALLKMLHIASEKGLVEGFADLNLVPLTISYEFEPCDMFKTEELVHKHLSLPYTKDDKMSIIRGIRDPKGRIHMQIGDPITKAELTAVGDENQRNEWFRRLAELIDCKIQTDYRLWPNHFIAYDLLTEQHAYQDRYTVAEKERFEAHLAQRMQEMKGPEEALREQFLFLYAKPVQNRENWEKNAIFSD